MFYDDTQLRKDFKRLLDIRDEHHNQKINETHFVLNDRINKTLEEISNIYKQLNKLLEQNKRNIKNGKYVYEINLPEENFNVQFETKETFIECFEKEIYKKKAFKANKKAWRAINEYIQNFKNEK